MLSEEPSQPACYLIRAMVTAVSFPEIKKDPFGDGLINTFFLINDMYSKGIPELDLPGCAGSAC